ncbi:MAG: hypothetical protein KatS3mg058_0935 [Roseiflexus sp.]|nr:MAG: hypothetical protein KatS3mg058_0935 [Roseiflexus sp.]
MTIDDAACLSFRAQRLVIPSAATCHSERSDLSFRAQRLVIPSAATCHSERSEESKRVAHDLSRCSG